MNKFLEDGKTPNTEYIYALLEEKAIDNKQDANY